MTQWKVIAKVAAPGMGEVTVKARVHAANRSDAETFLKAQARAEGWQVLSVFVEPVLPELV